ncbi:TPA: acyltransferase family protein [Streptococcus pneumoniae]
MKKIKEYDILKIMAIILVVLSHSAYYKISSNYGGMDYQQYLNSHSAFTLYKILGKFMEIIYYFHMPLFMAILGVFFSIQIKKDRWNKIEKLLTSKFKRLILPFFVFTLLYSLPLKYISNYYNGVSFWRAITGQFLLLGNSHLWYLYALFIIFIISFYCLRRDTSIFVYLSLYIIHVLSFLIHITLVSAPLQFLFWFSMGFLFESKRRKYNIFLENHKWISLLFFVLFIFLVVLNFLFKSDFKVLSRFFVDLLAILGSLICYNISYFLSNKTKILDSKLLNLILINGLGIYIFSDTLNYFILSISYFVSDRFMFTSFGIIIIFLIRFVFTLFLGLVFTLLFKKVFPKYSWLVN